MPNAKQRLLFVTQFFPAKDIHSRYDAFLEALPSSLGINHHVHVETAQSHPALEHVPPPPKLLPVHPL